MSNARRCLPCHLCSAPLRAEWGVIGSDRTRFTAASFQLSDQVIFWIPRSSRGVTNGIGRLIFDLVVLRSTLMGGGG